ncbi:hypothetical protein E4P42_06530 [Mycobacterium sp. PS03-16]|uniref:hypothetical protein n=1 Tax=Mycobacterium sp. PS03-16 TaxID=2559611 RepID=UPI0010741632|nr:hypothetical protein [Mycobacterium sp. PS03-16]TFV60023.1 hypothetical protein E4P42_06530 [Mycobacterium sp. PS03-16]
MTTALIALAVTAPFALTAALAWVAHRNGILRLHLDQFRVFAPMRGRLSDGQEDRDFSRAQHDLEAVRSRFEEHPVWPSSGAVGERR